jgi:hypothetical protein
MTFRPIFYLVLAVFILCLTIAFLHFNANKEGLAPEYNVRPYINISGDPAIDEIYIKTKQQLDILEADRSAKPDKVLITLITNKIKDWKRNWQGRFDNAGKSELNYALTILTSPPEMLTPDDYINSFNRVVYTIERVYSDVQEYNIMKNRPPTVDFGNRPKLIMSNQDAGGVAQNTK